jgi:polar amino acid transport system permease protein
MKAFPLWLAAAILLALLYAFSIAADPQSRTIFLAVSRGIGTTLFVTLIAYVAACLIGLAVALLGFSRFRLVREAATFYVEIVRGIPMLVLLLYVAFGVAPALILFWNGFVAPYLPGDADLAVRDFGFLWRAVLALVVSYSAFLAEIFRGGIQSVGEGQIEAGRALGLKRGQLMRFVILPQALRTMLPPLGNELVAMIKDSALVSVLGVQDVTQLGKLYAASTFLYFETYTIVAFVYLLTTITLSLAVRALERHLRTGGAQQKGPLSRPFRHRS